MVLVIFYGDRFQNFVSVPQGTKGLYILVPTHKEIGMQNHLYDIIRIHNFSMQPRFGSLADYFQVAFPYC